MSEISAAFDAMQSNASFLAAPPHVDPDEFRRLSHLVPDGHVGVFSSGSTATPRCVLRTWDSWRVSFPVIDEFLDVRPADFVGLIGSPTSTMVLFAALHALHHDAVPVVWDSHKVVWDSHHHDRRGEHVDVLHAVPTAAETFLDDVIDGHRISPRLVVIAGAASSARVWEKADRAGVRLVEYYGAVETSFIAWRESPIGFDPVPGVDIEIRDEDVWVRSPYLAIGYLDTRDGPLRREGEWVTVGDRGALDAHGRLTIAGRADSAVTTAGHTIVVEDVEAALRCVPGVGDVVVVGIDHEQLGEIIAAVVTGSASTRELRAAARLLPPPARPRVWIHRDELPRLPSGKFDRVTIRRQVNLSRIAI